MRPPKSESNDVPYGQAIHNSLAIVTAPGEPGSETWPKGDHWKTGGGPVWVTGNYDPATNLAYWGTGNGGPWMGDQRPGDNLYTASTVALDAATGRIKGHMQYTPNESFDWDEVSPPILVDFRRGGREITGAINVARNGYLYFLDRTGGSLRFVDGKPYVNQNVFRSLDPKTGRPDIIEANKPGTGKRAQYCPSLHGGKNWPPIAFNPQTRMIYVPANNNLCGAMEGVPVTYTQVGAWTCKTQAGASPFRTVILVTSPSSVSIKARVSAAGTYMRRSCESLSMSPGLSVS